jgi:large subunit ribosomal protein L21
MYAVIKTGGKQYRVSEGDILAVERLEGEQGSILTFDRVLAVGGGEGLKLGKPFLEGAKVEAEVLTQGRAKKVLVFKFKRRKGYKRTKGHRQYFTRLRVKSINA